MIAKLLYKKLQNRCLQIRRVRLRAWNGDRADSLAVSGG